MPHPSSLPRAFPGKPLLCYVTDRRLLAAGEASPRTSLVLRKIEAAVRAEVDWIQIREKDICAKDGAALVRAALGAVGDRDVRILVNDRIDIALAENAGGVHLGRQSIPVAEARKFLEQNRDPARQSGPVLTGVSCHSLAEVAAAARDGADYVFFGPVFATPSKIAFAAPQGLAKLAEVCQVAEIPVLAIGGITTDNAASCLSAGAAGIAAIRLFQDAVDIRAVTEKLRQL
ncbi:MAG TPA: thiamine phosphate synthase [Candidatus Saccharimonadales bacterium]|nr:thiamine phosphate synthase [Candidatus Saccharimonadales bacterium]